MRLKFLSFILVILALSGLGYFVYSQLHPSASTTLPGIDVCNPPVGEFSRTTYTNNNSEFPAFTSWSWGPGYYKFHSKYWLVEYKTHFDEKTNQYISTGELLYKAFREMTFEVTGPAYVIPGQNYEIVTTRTNINTIYVNKIGNTDPTELGVPKESRKTFREKRVAPNTDIGEIATLLGSFDRSKNEVGAVYVIPTKDYCSKRNEKTKSKIDIVPQGNVDDRANELKLPTEAVDEYRGDAPSRQASMIEKGGDELVFPNAHKKYELRITPQNSSRTKSEGYFAGDNFLSSQLSIASRSSQKQYHYLGFN